jgi:hypothetical protein
MFGMADGDPTAGLWNWSVRGDIDDDLVRGALAGALERSVVRLGEEGDVLCDVYGVGGDFPTLIDVYLAPGGIAEATAASAVAVRLGAAVLLPDDTLNPTRYVLDRRRPRAAIRTALHGQRPGVRGRDGMRPIAVRRVSSTLVHCHDYRSAGRPSHVRRAHVRLPDERARQ